MSNLTKKIVVASLALAMVFSLGVGFVSAEEHEYDDLDEMYEQVMQMMDEVEEETEEATEEEDVEYEEVSIAGIPEGFTFTETLQEGARGEDVKYLQILLNTNPETQVAESGAGAPGNETEFFGPATKAAVVNFHQEVLGVDATHGIVGPQTRAELNAMLEGEEVETPDEEEASDDMGAVLEQLTALAEALETLQARLDEIEKDMEDPAVDGEEGELSARQLSRPRATSLEQGAFDEVMGARLEAEDSDITLQRIDMQLSVEEGNDERVRSLVDYVTVHHAGEEVSRRYVNRDTVGTTEEEDIRFSGLNLRIDEGSSEDISFGIALDEDAYDYDSEWVKIDLTGNEALRGLDGAGINQLTGIDDGEREVTIEDEDEDEITMESTDAIEEGILMIDEDSFNEVDLLEFELDTDKDIYLEDLEVDLDDADIDDDDGYFDYLALYDEDGFVDEVDTTRDDLIFDVDADYSTGTHTFTVVGETWDIAREDQGHTVSVNVVSATAYDMDDEFIELDDAEEIDAEGEDITLYVVMPDFTYSDSSFSLIEDDEKAFTDIVFDITAMEGKILPHYIAYEDRRGNVEDLEALFAEFDGDELDVLPAVDAVDATYDSWNGDVDKDDVVYLHDENGVYVVTDENPSEKADYNEIMEVHYLDADGGDTVDTSELAEGDFMFVHSSDSDADGLYIVQELADGPLADQLLVAEAGDMTELDFVMAFGFEADDHALEAGDSAEALVEAIIDPGTGRNAQLSVSQIGWATEDYDEDDDNFINHFNFDDSEDFIEVLETVRNYISG